LEEVYFAVFLREGKTMKHLKIGLLGLGQIGGGVYSLLRSKRESLKRKVGVSLEVILTAEKDASKKRLFNVPDDQFTNDAYRVVRDSNVDVVVELVGGIHPAKELILAALRSGKDVVTANKALLAEHGREIFSTAKQAGKNVFFEASVGGGIPVIKALREGLIANQINSIYSIINGTSNYILTRMTDEKLDFKSALKLAQEKGYAERDPRLDIEGIDAAHKITILAGLAFGGWPKFSDVCADGISQIQSEDIAFAEEFGYRIKLLAIAKKVDGEIEARVQPTLLPKRHILSSVNDSFNAILMQGDEVGDVLFYGRGAGRRPTASAVVSDLVDLARIHFQGVSAPQNPEMKPLKIKNISSLLSRYYLRLNIVDQPGVLAQISAILGRHKISISDVIQRERHAGSVVPLILLTHGALEGAIRKAVTVIDRLKIVKGKSQVLRIGE
jgi:homoserine dehydrogenase